MAARLPIAAAVALALPALGAVADDEGIVVQDLAYGEVLFEYFQEDYFSALTRLLAAQQRGELEHHGTEAELMLGGLYLSYGQHRLAGEIFERVLAQNVDPALHDLLQRWAADELRSLNGQIEYLLRESARKAGRGKELERKPGEPTD